MKTSGAFWKLTALVLALLTLAIVGIGFPVYAEDPIDPGYPYPWKSIPQQEDARPVPAFIGQPAEPHPIAAPLIPPNPSMAPGPWSAFHNDTYMSDTYPTSGPLGPLGKSPVVSSILLASADRGYSATGTIVFDRDGRLLGFVMRADPDGVNMRAWLTLFDPDTLEPLAWLGLPPEPRPPLDGRLMELPTGAYAYLNPSDEVVVGTPDRNIWVVSHEHEAPFSFKVERKYLLQGIIDKSDEFQAVQPDFFGRLWFATKGGMVGTVDLKTGDLLGTTRVYVDEKIENATAIDETGGVYLDSTKALYRFDADRNGAPTVTWREPYDGGTHVKVLSRGSGTTPTLMGKDFVTIADNADPQIHVLVYRRAKEVQGPRLVCAVPVFKPGQSASENSLIATDKSIVIENNFGYRGIKSTLHGSTSKPGIARIDVDENGCRTVWTNWEESVASAATEKMALANGLIYAYTKSKGPVTTDAYYFTAVDFDTGKTVYKVLAGTGVNFNDHLLGIYLGPNGTLYIGVLGGIVSMRDGK